MPFPDMLHSPSSFEVSKPSLAGISQVCTGEFQHSWWTESTLSLLRIMLLTQRTPTTGIETPKREKNGRQVLRPDEYTKMLSLAGANPRDYAVLQVFLQTGIRVSELANLTISNIDFIKPSITVRGKGSVEREIALEKKGIHALKSYLAIRGESVSRRVFLNYQGEPISERGIRKLVVKYRQEAGITKKASCYTLRHTFATYKAEKGVSAYQLQQWLGHANLNTTQIYVHLGKQNARKIMQDTSLS